jgi:hypothetical protein
MIRDSALRLALVPLVVCAAILTGCDFDKRDFLNNSQATFEGICKGDVSIEKYINWEQIKIDGEEVGQMYVTMSTDYERSSYKKARLERLASVYKARGLSPMTVKNWRIETRGVESATVVADAPSKGKIIIDLQKYGAAKKIISIQTR